MTADTMQPMPPAEPAASGRSVWVNFRDVILTPSATFEDVGQRPRWLAPLLVIMAILVVMSLLLLPMNTAMQELGVRQRDLSPEERERALQMIETFKWIGIVVAPFFGVIITAILSLLFWAWAAISGARNAGFLVAFISLLYASAIGFLEALAQAVVVWVKGAEQVAIEGAPSFGLALFVAGSDMSRWLYGLVANVNFFSIWYAIVVAIAGIHALRMSKGAATAFAVFLWLVVILRYAMQAPAGG